MGIPGAYFMTRRFGFRTLSGGILAMVVSAADPAAPANALTILNLEANTRQTLALGNPPLGVAFGNDGLALILTTAEFLLLDPATGSLRVLDTVASAGKNLPVPSGTLPPDI